MLGTFILLFGWFGFNAASTFASTDVQFAVVATNTAIAAAFGATVAMFWIMFRTGKPDPGMMANGMLAGLVAITAPCAFVDAVGGRGHRHHRRRPRHRVGVLRRAQAQGRRSGGRHLASTASAASSACSRSASSPTAATAPAGTDSGLRPASRASSRATSGPARRRRPLGALVIATVIFGVRLRLLQDPERAHEGRHPPDRRRTSSPASTCPRWASWPTRSSRARSAGSAATRPAGAPASGQGDRRRVTERAGLGVRSVRAPQPRRVGAGSGDRRRGLRAVTADVPVRHPASAAAGGTRTASCPRAFVRPALRFTQVEAAGGLVMLLAAVVALLWANSPWYHGYEAAPGAPFVLRLGNVSTSTWTSTAWSTTA